MCLPTETNELINEIKKLLNETKELPTEALALLEELNGTGKNAALVGYFEEFKRVVQRR